jgi:RNA polymerase sigma factor (sigma-70 family)
MTSSPQGEWPTDADGLAGIASDATQPQAVRERALEELLPTIRRVARRVATRFAGPYAADLSDEAAGKVWPALKGFQSGASFEAWCYGVLRNYMVDRLRQEQRERAARARLPPVDRAPDLQQALERALDRQGRLPEADLATLRAWPLRQRLALLGLTGLWEKVAGEEWEAWVGEYRAHSEGDLPDPFPPEHLRQADDVAQRNAILSGALQVPRNTLSVWLFRYKQRLRDLHYVRGLLDNA